MKQDEAEQLPVHERMAVLLIISFILVLTVITWKNQTTEFPNNTGNPHYTIDPNITVLLEGAVQNPGPIVLKRGANISDALQEAIMSPEADLSKINILTKLRNKQTIQIPEKQTITVHVTGALKNPGEYKVYKGSKISDLLPKLILDEDASIDNLQPDKRLRNRGKIRIPKQKKCTTTKKERIERERACEK